MQITKDIDQSVQSADISIDGQTGDVQAIPAQMGRQLLVDQTMVDILNTIRTAQPMTVTLRTSVITPKTDDHKSAQSVSNAKQFLSAPILIRYGQQHWLWQRDDLIRLIAMNKTANGIEVVPDSNAIATAVDRLAQYIDTGSVEARVKVVNGRASIVQPSRHGVRLDRAAAIQKIGDAFFATNRVVELPTIEVSPQLSVSQISALRFNDVLSTGRSSFAGSAKYRITNIMAGATHIDGVLIAPGATFSFNTEVGEINEANGFVKGYAVVANRTQLEWGGGVCQVSTSLFRAAFYAGLPFKEWHAHPYYIRWYDDYAYPDIAVPGLDAAIYTGELDLRFINDTGNWVMIDTTIDTERQILDVQLRGTATGRAVRLVCRKITNTIPAPKEPKYIDDPTLATGKTKQTDKAKDGMSVVATGIITVGAKISLVKNLPVILHRWPNIFLRGTGNQAMTNQLFSGAVLYTPSRQKQHGWQDIDWAVVRDQLGQLAELGMRQVVLRRPAADYNHVHNGLTGWDMANLERCLDMVHAANMQAMVSLLGVTAWGALRLPEWHNSPDVVGWLQGRTTQPIVTQGAAVIIDGRWQRLHIANPFTTEAWLQAQHLLIQTVMGYFASHSAIHHWLLAEGWSQLAPATAPHARTWMHNLVTHARAVAPRATLAGTVDGPVLVGRHGISLALLAEYYDVLLVDCAIPALGSRTTHRLSAPALFLHAIVSGLTQRAVWPLARADNA
jgi:vancomycin resistance protein YoaR